MSETDNNVLITCWIPPTTKDQLFQRLDLLRMFINELQDGREKSLALTKLDETEMWACRIEGVE